MPRLVYDHVVLQNLGSQIHRKIQKKNSVMLDLKHSPAAHPSAFQVEVEESEAALERRTAAEERVRQVLYASGERITHGDLLTFQKLGQARALRAGGVRAVDRLSELRIHLKRSVSFHFSMV